MSVTKEQKEKAYQRYRDAKTDGNRVSFLGSSEVLSADYTNFALNWKPVTNPFEIDISHLGELDFASQIFYQVVLSNTFHLYFRVSLKPKASGAGNWQNVRVSRDGDSYQMGNYGLTVPNQLIQMSKPEVEVTPKSLSFKEGLVRVEFSLVDGVTTESGQEILKYTVHVYGRLFSNLYLVPFEFQ